MKLIRIELETRNFSFCAYGKTEEEAREVMKKLWNTHKKQAGDRASTMYSAEEILEDCNYIEVESGVGYRDYEKLI